MSLIKLIMRNESVSEKEAIEILREEFRATEYDLEATLYNLGFEPDYCYEAYHYLVNINKN